MSGATQHLSGKDSEKECCGAHLSLSQLLLPAVTVPTETIAGQLTSGPNSEAAAAIDKLEELRKTIKLTNLDWKIWRYTSGLTIDGK